MRISQATVYVETVRQEATQRKATRPPVFLAREILLLGYYLVWFVSNCLLRTSWVGWVSRKPMPPHRAALRVCQVSGLLRFCILGVSVQTSVIFFSSDFRL